MTERMAEINPGSEFEGQNPNNKALNAKEIGDAARAANHPGVPRDLTDRMRTGEKAIPIMAGGSTPMEPEEPEKPVVPTVIDLSPETIEAIGRVQAEAIQAQIMAQLTGLRAGARNLPTLEGEIKEGYKPITVQTDYGPKEIIWREDLELGIQDMRRTLLDIETSPEEGGGRTKQLELQRMILLMDHFQNSNDEKEKEIGERMHREFMARYTLQSAFVKFRSAGDTETGAQTVLALTREYLNFFFKDGADYGLQVWRFIQLYDQKALEYLQINDEEAVAKFNAGLREQVKFENKDYFEEVTDIDRQSAQIAAERLWQMLARMSSRDVLIDKDTREIIDEEYVRSKFGFDITAFKSTLADDDPRRSWKINDWLIDLSQKNKDFKMPKFDFLGNPSANGAAFAERKDVNANNWMMTRIDSDRPAIGLVKGLDLGSTDGFQDIPDMVKSYYRGVLLRTGMDFNEAEEKAILASIKLIGVDNVEKGLDLGTGTIIKDKDGKPDFGWKKGIDLDIAKFDFKGKGKEEEIRVALGLDGNQFREMFYKDGKFIGIDFSQTRSPSFFTPWVYLRMIGPENARKTLEDDPDSFFRKPTTESFVALKKIFGYSGGDQFKKLALILGNFGEELRSGRLLDKGLAKADRQMTDMIIKSCATQAGLTFEEIKQVAEKVLGNSLIDNIMLAGSYFRADRFFLQFLQDIIIGIIKEATGLK